MAMQQIALKIVSNAFKSNNILISRDLMNIFNFSQSELSPDFQKFEPPNGFRRFHYWILGFHWNSRNSRNCTIIWVEIVLSVLNYDTAVKFEQAQV